MSTLRAGLDSQITLDVKPHSRCSENGYLFAHLKIKGDFPIQQDLNGGDVVTVSISDMDGNVLASGQALVASPHFVDIVEKGIYLGVDRVHTATLTGEG